MNTKIGWAILGILFIVILVMTWLLFALPAPGEQETATTTPPAVNQPVAPDPNQPLSARVTVTSPKAHSTVEKTFVVAGSAPGNWFFEASFPIKVLDKDGNVLANTYATAQGDWMTTDLVTYTSTVTISGSYTGPATLVLLRDNPSGLPENDDAVEVQIIIQ